MIIIKRKRAKHIHFENNDDNNTDVRRNNFSLVTS